MDEPTVRNTTQPSLWSRLRALIKRLGPAGPMAIMSSTFPPLGGFVLIGFISRIAPWLQAHPLRGLLLYIAGFSSMTALALLPTYACSILGGWTFHFATGFPASMLAFVMASLFSYVLNRRAAGDRVVNIIAEHPKWEAVINALLGSGFWKSFWILTLIRLPPTSPFAATNFIMGTIKAPLLPFLLATFVGMAPRTGVVVWAASHASTLDFKQLQASQLWMTVAGIIITCVVVAYIGQLAQRAIQRATATETVEA